MTALAPRNVKLWTCSVCGHVGEWTGEWRWYGSMRDMDDGRWDRITVVCSPECRAEVDLRLRLQVAP